MEGRRLSPASLESINAYYMRTKVDEVRRIYQPMLSSGHWYLMIIDIPRTAMICLDSCISSSNIDKRKEEMEKVALELEGMTLARKWLSGPTAVRPPGFLPLDSSSRKSRNKKLARRS
ncbi:hypothetical protein PIB30_010261 [Stylosanthes scabra]|uniref:Ubiquitin-like protease family profile domain-containing protein n=1 Tax=Stylosanthes scabra TaxID=79078 RepID=A0ABU6T5C1_9FABA|nr:hypothetical protein [Stylosanthes scabra]